MSKINKIRLVNLNYNNNTMRVEDENFYFQGDNTMLNLRNGGGKSVLVQMIIAPFVNRRYRNMKDRTFESYFTSKTPTYILVEWKLDDGGGYLLTGMMVRKKEVSSDENSRHKLDIVNFIHEYRERNDFDINSIPVIEEQKGKRVIKSFANSKKFFEDLKKKKDLKFNYYDMNNSVTTKNYFEKLMEYKINHREWETIIKQINIKESGLSELFTKAKDTSGLVREWFLPAIENKLKIDEDRIENYRELMNRYIKQYRANKSNIDKKSKMELFNELSKEIINACEEFIDSVNKREEKKNQIANTLAYLKENLSDREREALELEGFINDLENQIQELNYERESIKIYNNKNEIEEIKENIQKQSDLVKDCENKEQNLERKCNVIECARIHRNYQSTSKELQQYETELEILNKKSRDNAPLINDLGYNIKIIMEKELQEIDEKLNHKLTSKEDLQNEKEEVKKTLKNSRMEINNLSSKKGELSSNIKQFDKIEERFEKKYDLRLSRNIEGYFDGEKLLSVEKKIKEQELEYIKERKTVGEKVLSSEDILNGMESEKLKNIRLTADVKKELENKTEEFSNAENEIEKRKDILKYIDFHEDKVFDSDEIVDTFDRKIELLKNDEMHLQKIKDKIQREIEKLKSGKVMELPKDVELKLRNKDITIMYGMEWLNKNGYSLEKNEEIVINNPFIPYSLIMDSKEIEILENEAMDIFTSHPISIIDRKDIDTILKKSVEDGEIVDLEGIKFFISFNNKLLNEKERLKIIEDRESELHKAKEDISEKKNSIKFYEEKRNRIKYSGLTLKIYEDLKERIEFLQEEEGKLREKEIELEKDIIKIKSEIEELQKRSKELERNIEKSKNKWNDFIELKEKYEEYKKHKENMEYVLERMSVINEEIKLNEKRDTQIDYELMESTRAISEYNKLKGDTLKELSIYNIYKSGKIINKDKEDILAEFKALTKEILKSEEELKEKISELTQKFNQVERELNLKAEQYNIEEHEYINESYDIQRELDFKNGLTKERNNLQNQRNELSRFKKELAVSEKKLEMLYSALKEKFDKEEAKSKELLVAKDFKHEINVLKIEIKESNSKMKEIKKDKTQISQNITNLSEFDDLKITEEIQVTIDFENMDAEVGKLKRDLNNIKDEEVKRERNLSKLVVDMEIKDEFNHESLFKEPIHTLKNLTSNPVEFKNHLNLVVNSYEMLIEKLMTDIEFIQKEEGKLLESLLEYVKDVHVNIEKIDDNSSITIGSKRLKMLNISVADWEENKELYAVRIKDYVEQVRNQSIETLEKNEDIEDIISNRINIFKLYDEIVGIGTVGIKLYKVEEDKQRQITWNEVSKNSGGEGFLSAFVILSSLLSYMRKDESELFSNRESGKVLLMDNPFAQTSSAHLLKPLMDIAKKSNTQLICLTGLGGDSIYNRFDNIYVLNLISSKLKQGVKYLRSEHTKGEEEEENEVLVASRFKIEEQMRLF